MGRQFYDEDGTGNSSNGSSSQGCTPWEVSVYGGLGLVGLDRRAGVGVSCGDKKSPQAMADTSLSDLHLSWPTKASPYL